MAGKRFFGIKIDPRQVEALADDLGALSAEDFGRASIIAVNQVADRTYDRSIKDMSGINLSEQYITSKMTVARATDIVNPSASITASGDLTILGHYDPRQLIQPATRPGRSRGDPKRGIPPGSKQAGIEVTVTKGRPKAISKGFTMTLRNSGKTGVFIRENGRIKHLYGPSVYSLFRYSIDASFELIADDLTKTVGESVDAVLNKALK